MDKDTDGSMSIQGTELGQSVLTLDEVVQMFEVESAMYNIKMSDENMRTVVLTKRKYEVDGENKLIIMIRDVSDKVRLEQEQIK